MVKKINYQQINRGFPIRNDSIGNPFQKIKNNLGKNYKIPVCQFYAPGGFKSENSKTVVITGIVPIKGIIYYLVSGNLVRTGLSFSFEVSGNIESESSASISVSFDGVNFINTSLPPTLFGETSKDELSIPNPSGGINEHNVMYLRVRDLHSDDYITSLKIYAEIDSRSLGSTFMGVNSILSIDQMNTLNNISNDLKHLGRSRSCVLFPSNSSFIRNKYDRYCGFPHRLASVNTVFDGPYGIRTKNYEDFIDVTIRYNGSTSINNLSLDEFDNSRPLLSVVALHEGLKTNTLERDITPLPGDNIHTFRIPANKNGSLTWFFIKYSSGDVFKFEEPEVNVPVSKYQPNGINTISFQKGDPGNTNEHFFNESSFFQFCISKCIEERDEDLLNNEPGRLYSDIRYANYFAGNSIEVKTEKNVSPGASNNSYQVQDIGYVDILGICAQADFTPSYYLYDRIKSNTSASSSAMRGIIEDLERGLENVGWNNLSMRQPNFSLAGFITTGSTVNNEKFGPWCPALQMTNDSLVDEVTADDYWNRTLTASSRHIRGRVSTVLGTPLFFDNSFLTPPTELSLINKSISVKLYYCSFNPRSNNDAIIKHKWLFHLVDTMDIFKYMNEPDGMSPPIIGSLLEEIPQENYINDYSSRISDYMSVVEDRRTWNGRRRTKCKFANQVFYQDELDMERGVLIRETPEMLITFEQIYNSPSFDASRSYYLVVENVRAEPTEEHFQSNSRGYPDSHALVFGMCAWITPPSWEID